MKEAGDENNEEREKLLDSVEDLSKSEAKEKNTILKEIEPEGENKIMEKIKQTDIFEQFEINRRRNKKNIFCTQTIILMKMTLKIFYRHYKRMILTVASPFIICLFLLLLQFGLEKWSGSFIEKNPPKVYIDKIPKCPCPKDCITVKAIILDKNQKEENINEVNSIMSYVAEKNDLTFKTDIDVDLNLKNYSMLTQYLKNNKNKTSFAVVFCYDYLDSDFNGAKVKIPCKPQFTKEGEIYKFYSIVYNMTNGPNDFLIMPYLQRQKDPKLMKLKIDIDNAYLELFHNKSKETGEVPKIQVDYKNFPNTEHRFFDGTNLINNFGCPFFCLFPMTLFIITLIDVVKEKHLKLRISLLNIGLKNSAFWTSRLLISFFFSIILVLLFLGFVYSLQWELFSNTPFLIMFTLFFLFTFDLQLLAFLMNTLIDNPKTAYAGAFFFIFSAGVIQSVFTVPFFFQNIYEDNVGWGFQITKGFLYAFFPFTFSKAFLEIASISSTKLSPDTFMNMVGREYKFSDLFEVIEADKVLFKGHYKIPATYISFIYLFGEGIIFLILIYYFDNVKASNRGKAQSPLFFIYKIGRMFGICKAKKSEINEEEKQIFFKERNKDLTQTLAGFNNTIDQSLTNIIDDVNNKNDRISLEKDGKMKIGMAKGYQTVVAEYNKIIISEKKGKVLDGLRIVGATINYKSSNGKKLKALHNIFLDVTKGELLSLLGDSEEGKTTIINALCGNISLTEGYAKINGENITDENDESEYKRKFIGLCLQHDILWEELTPYEHIELYASIRNYDKNDIKKIVEIKMKEVNLENVTNDKVSTFSDGMKRRISILLSTVGNPNVVFLDEPTTGLDAVNRRFIWNMIKEIKKKSSVILTTHSISEAEFLSDRICIIKKGEMKCIGTSLELKDIYGEGYIFTFICNKDCKDQVKNIILGLSKDINLISSKGDNLLFSIDFDQNVELNWFIKILNKDFSDEKLKPLKGLFKECKIENISIEEIFLAREKGEDADDDDEIPKGE